MERGVASVQEFLGGPAIANDREAKQWKNH
jgi:hypothetical protein